VIKRKSKAREENLLIMCSSLICGRSEFRYF
jgi:hypothetical protein